MKIIVLQHISIEDPGYIKDLMIKDKFNLKTIKLYDGEKIPKNLKYKEKKYKISSLSMKRKRI